MRVFALAEQRLCAIIVVFASIPDRIDAHSGDVLLSVPVSYRLSYAKQAFARIS